MREYTFIYVLKDPRTNGVRYVGKANDLENRLMRHLRYIDNDPNHRKRDWIYELRALGLEPYIIPIMKVPYSRWKKFERAAIRSYRKSGIDLLNMSLGGEGFDWSIDPERRSEITTEMWQRPEYREQMIRANTGRKHSEETKALQSQRAKERWENPDYRKRQSAINAERFQSKEFKEKSRRATQKRWENPEFRDKIRRASNSEESIKKRSASLRETLSTPEAKKKRSEVSKKMWAKKKREQELVSGQLSLGMGCGDTVD